MLPGSEEISNITSACTRTTMRVINTLQDYWQFIRDYGAKDSNEGTEDHSDSEHQEDEEEEDDKEDDTSTEEKEDEVVPTQQDKTSETKEPQETAPEIKEVEVAPVQQDKKETIPETKEVTFVSLDDASVDVPDIVTAPPTALSRADFQKLAPNVPLADIRYTNRGTVTDQDVEAYLARRAALPTPGAPPPSTAPPPRSWVMDSQFFPPGKKLTGDAAILWGDDVGVEPAHSGNMGHYGSAWNPRQRDTY